MRWPWVSRELYDEAIKLASDAVAHAGEARQDNRDLLLKYHAIKVAGGAIPEPTPTLDRPAIDPVMAAITAKAGPDRTLRSRMAREAMKARALHIPDHEIIQQIEQGIPDDEGVPA